MKLLEKYAMHTTSENDIRLVFCRIEEFIFDVSKNIAVKDLSFTYRDFSDEDLGSLFTFLMDEDIPYTEDKIGDIVTIKIESIWKEILKRKALINPKRVMLVNLVQELGTHDEYTEVIGVVDFGKDGKIERDQFELIISHHPKLKNHSFDVPRLLKSGYVKSNECKYIQLEIKDYDFFKLGDHG